MPRYKYKARDKDGYPISGNIYAEDDDEFEKKFENLSYTLVYYNELKSGLENDVFLRFRKVKSKELVAFSVQISTLIEAGLPLMTGLEIMESQTQDEYFRNIISEIKKNISAGLSFSEALEKHPKTFSSFYINMIRAGEATGELDNILKSVAFFLEKSEENKQKVISAMIYPATMFVIAFMVVIFLLVRVLPSFVSVFDGAGIKLPLPTVILLATSHFIAQKWYIVLIGFGIIVYLIKSYASTEKGRYYFDLFKFRVPIFGDLILKATVARFGRTFGTLVKSSVPMLQSLEIVAKTVGNAVVERMVEKIKLNVSQGGTIAEQIEISGTFPVMVGKMVSVGENSGALDKMLFKVADFYDVEVENKIKGLTSVIEPVMIVVMGIIIGIMVMSVMLPMFDMINIARK